VTQLRSGEDAPTRKGLVGKPRVSKGADDLPELIEQRRKRMLGKSLSVTITPHELEEQMGEGVVVKSASYAQHTFGVDGRHSESHCYLSNGIC
jgi:hypothetical protein